MKTIGAKLPTLVELAGDNVIQTGDTGLEVKIVQELLAIGGFATVVDGDFGPATRAAVTAFQTARGLRANGRVEEATWSVLWASIRQALAPIVLPDQVAGFIQHHTPAYAVQRLALRYAKQHLRYNAHEIGQNQGPWVRLFLHGDPVKGEDGPSYSWCGAFVTFCIRQAMENLNVPYDPDAKIWGRSEGWSCDRIKAWASAHGSFFPDPSPEHVRAGTVFLLKKSEGDWEHTGIVETYDASGGTVKTVEGNTNLSGGVNGVGVFARFRAVTKLDFVDGYCTIA